MKMAFRRQKNIMGSSSLFKSAVDANKKATTTTSSVVSSSTDYNNKHDNSLMKDIHKLASVLFNYEFELLEHLLLKIDFSSQLIKKSIDKVKSVLTKHYPNNTTTVNTVINECSSKFEIKIAKNKKQLMSLYTKQKQLKHTQTLSIYKKHCSLCPTIAHHTCGHPLHVLNNSYIICSYCKLLYSNNEIECLCMEDKVMFYSSVLPLGYSDRFFTASYKTPHCNTMHEQMIPCKQCRNILFIDIKDNKVQCLNRKCLFKIEHADNESLMWNCASCGNEFVSAVKIYNSVEEMVLKNEIKRTKIVKETIDNDDNNTCNNDFVHKSHQCNGMLLKGMFKHKEIIVCEKCEEVIYKGKFDNRKDNNVYSNNSNNEEDKLKDNKIHKTRNSMLLSHNTTSSLVNNNNNNYNNSIDYLNKHLKANSNNISTNNNDTSNSSIKAKQSNKRRSNGCVLFHAKTMTQSLISLVKQQNEFNRRYQSKPKEKSSSHNILNNSTSDNDSNNNTINNNNYIPSQTEINTSKNKVMFTKTNTISSLNDSSNTKTTPLKRQPPLLQIIDENTPEPSTSTKTIVITDTPHSFKEPQTPLPTPFNHLSTPTSIFVFNRRLSSKINNFLKSETPIELDLSKYTIHNEIGSGSYSTIYLVKENETQNEYALKKLIIDEVDYVAQIQNEICLVRYLSTLSINIIPFINFCINKLDATTHVIYLLMPLAQGDFSSEILSEKTRSHLFTVLKSLIHTLSVMQDHNICHRDIKPQNILYDNKTNQFYLCDFDEVVELEGLSMYEELDIKGTAMFMSHILYKAFKQGEKTVRHNAYKSDVYSLGMCFVYAITKDYDVLDVVRENDDEENRKMLLTYLDKDNGVSNALIDVVCEMIRNDEECRKDFIEIETLIKEKYELVF